MILNFFGFEGSCHAHEGAVLHSDAFRIETKISISGGYACYVKYKPISPMGILDFHLIRVLKW
jgi:hypothetical protein